MPRFKEVTFTFIESLTSGKLAILFFDFVYAFQRFCMVSFIIFLCFFKIPTPCNASLIRN